MIFQALLLPDEAAQAGDACAAPASCSCSTLPRSGCTLWHRASSSSLPPGIASTSTTRRMSSCPHTGAVRARSFPLCSFLEPPPTDSLVERPVPQTPVWTARSQALRRRSWSSARGNTSGACAGTTPTWTWCAAHPSLVNSVTSCAPPDAPRPCSQIGCLGVSPQLRLYNLALTSTSPIEVFSDRVRAAAFISGAYHSHSDGGRGEPTFAPNDPRRRT